MAVNILDLAKAALTPDITQKISGLINENSAGTQKAIDGAIPSVLGGLLNFASASTEGPGRLMSLLTQGNYTNIIGNLSSLLSGGNATEDLLKTGKDLLGVVFGRTLNALTDLIANNSGIKSTSASSLLSLITPLLLGLLGQQTASQGANTANLLSLLSGQAEFISKVAPAGLAGVLGLANLGNLGSGLADATTKAATGAAGVTTPRAVEAAREGSGVGRWLIPLLLVGLLIPWFLFSRGYSEAPAPMAKQKVTPPPPPPPLAPTVQSTPIPPPPPPATASVESVPLPGGSTLSLTAGSFNYKLAKFLSDAADATVPRTFVFDNLNFEFGTTKLTTESEQIVKDLIAILKAYPSTEARLEGHTDSDGDAEANKTLSQERADAVKGLMTNDGIDAARLSTTGYGQEKPIASNDTDEGRAQNRRLELVVTKK